VTSDQLPNLQRLGKDAALDEASVISAEEKRAVFAKPRTRRPGVRAAAVDHIVVHPQVWAKAMSLAGGQAQRVQVLSATDVVVHNHPWRKHR
jgi:hypothetical protein